MYCRSIPICFWMFLIRVIIYQGGSVSLDTSNYRTPGGKAPDRQKKLEPGCLEISFTPGRPIPLVFWIFLIRVSIYQGCSDAPDTSNYRTPGGKRSRSTSETGARLSGNISCAWSPHAVRFRGFPDRCVLLPARFCFALYVELYGAKRETPPIDSGIWIATVWKYQLCHVAPFR